MIDIKSSFLNTLSADEILKLSYTELLKEEQTICILVNNEVFFEQPLFPILEFLFYYLMWKEKLCNKRKLFKKQNNFIYNSIETNENPLITFKKEKNGWRIDSPWKKFECDVVFELNEFINACDKLIKGN